MEITQLAEPMDNRFTNAPIGIIRSMQAYLGGLTELPANSKHDRWHVAYFGDERVGIAESSAVFMHECQRRGLPCERFYIGIITQFIP
ncbi:MAG: hypothetical protein HYX68_05325 [Planctomycetes bacterium]|nr:hypothetical protein [Planctomycetota bacterium]